MEKKELKKIAEYCRQNIEDYDVRVQLALGIMDRMRCPLSMADASLYDQIEQYAEEWAEENGYSVDEWDDDSRIDVEEILWVE